MADRKKKSSASTLKEIKKNTKLILENISNANLLVDILDVADTDEVEVLLAFIKSVHKIFTSFLNNKKLVQKKSSQNVEESEIKMDDQESPEDVFGAWLYEKYLAVINRLLKLLNHKISDVQELSLCTLMKLLVAEHKGLVTQNKSLFPVVLYGKILDELLNDEHDISGLIDRFGEFVEYDDIRYYTLKNLNKSFQNRSKENSQKFFVKNTYALLNQVKLPSSEEEMTNFLVVSDQTPAKKENNQKSDLFLLKAHKKQFSKAWLAFLSQTLTSEMHKKVLLNLHTAVIPYMNDPKLLMDFLTDSYNSGGAISLLALNGLFVLIHKHNLDYPDFYQKLYALLEPGIFHVKYQSRFFHLLDLFLTSTHLPAYLVAAFCKRLAQLALSAPPQGVILAIMFVKNLLKRHPSCQVLIHKKEVSKYNLHVLTKCEGHMAVKLQAKYYFFHCFMA